MEYDPETCTTAVNVELNCLRAEIRRLRADMGAK